MEGSSLLQGKSPSVWPCQHSWVTRGPRVQLIVFKEALDSVSVKSTTMISVSCNVLLGVLLQK